MEFMLVFFGAMFLISGILTVRAKEFGPKQGFSMPGPYLRGPIAVFAGIAQLFVGVLLIVAGLRQWLAG